MVQKAFINVTETGVEAAAATAGKFSQEIIFLKILSTMAYIIDRFNFFGLKRHIFYFTCIKINLHYYFLVGVSTFAIIAPPTLSFRADHPFIYFIADRKSGIIYFVGRFTGL